MMKKIFGLVLVLVMVLGLTTMAWADDMSEADLEAALDAGGTVTLTGDVKLTKELVIPDGVTLDGGGFIIAVADSVVADPTTWQMEDLGSETKHLVELGNNCTVKNVTFDSNGVVYGVHAYCKTGVKLSDVIIMSSAGAGLAVNGSDVTAENLVTSYNALGAVNVDPGYDVTSESKLSISGDNTKLFEFVAIWSDGDNITSDDNAVDIKISGGVYAGEVFLSDSSNGTITITGGTFDHDVSEYLADGYEHDANGTVSAVTGGNNPTNTPTNTPTYIPIYTPAEATVVSPKTFDAGVAMYISMSLMAAAGSAVVIGKNREL